MRYYVLIFDSVNMSSNYTHLHTFSDQARVNELQKLMWLETTRELDRFRTYPRENADSVIPPESSGQHDLTIQSQRNENTGNRNEDPADSQYHRALVLSRLHGGHSHSCSKEWFCYQYRAQGNHRNGVISKRKAKVKVTSRRSKRN